MIENRFSKRGARVCFGILTACALVGCGREEIKYEPVPAVSGSKASLPAVPNVPQRPEKDGDAYTVWGASYALRNRVHTKEVADQELKVVGYIVKTNLMDAPECAVHKGGKADPDGCRPAVPTFWIADSKDAALSVLTQVIPSAAVIDLDLPDGGAVALLREVRQRPQTRAMPVVACTAFGEHALRRDAEALGAHACRRKTPRGEAELVQLMRVLTSA
jgi:CheY-like chemotaxis protein